MELTYDQQADALYVSVLDGVTVSRTMELDAGTLVDLAADGAVIGIEVLSPARAWVGMVTERCHLSAELVRALTQAQNLGIYKAVGTGAEHRVQPASTSRVLEVA